MPHTTDSELAESLSDSHLVGDKIRQARLQRGLTQEQLAGGEYTKAFVSAVERGESGISDQALDVFARRLGVGINHFRVSDRSFELTIADVEHLLSHNQPHDALALVERLRDQDTLQRTQLPVVLYWQGKAYLALHRPGEAMDVLLPSLQKFEELGHAIEATRARHLIGRAHDLRGNQTEALHCYQQCLQAYLEQGIADPTFLLTIYTALGNVHLRLADHAKAVTFYDQALRVADDANDPGILAATYWGLHVAYKAQGDLEGALRVAQRSLAIYEMMGNQRLSIRMQHNLAVVHQAMGNWERARDLYEQTIVSAADLQDLPTRAQSLQGLVGYWTEIGDYPRATALLAEAITCAEATGDHYQRADTLLQGAQTYQKIGDLETALRYAQQSLSIAETFAVALKYPDACFMAATILTQLGRLTDAIPLYTKAYQAARASVPLDR